MSDCAFKSAPFPACTTDELRRLAASVEDRSKRAETTEDYMHDWAQLDKVNAEIVRREKVASGDMSVMTPAERLRHIRKQEAGA